MTHLARVGGVAGVGYSHAPRNVREAIAKVPCGRS